MQKVHIHYEDDHVQLGFYAGSRMKDPGRLLVGGGKHVRHVKVRTPRDIDAALFAALVREARLEVEGTGEFGRGCSALSVTQVSDSTATRAARRSSSLAALKVTEVSDSPATGVRIKVGQSWAVQVLVRAPNWQLRVRWGGMALGCLRPIAECPPLTICSILGVSTEGSRVLGLYTLRQPLNPTATARTHQREPLLEFQRTDRAHRPIG